MNTTDPGALAVLAGVVTLSLAVVAWVFLRMAGVLRRKGGGHGRSPPPASYGG